MGQGAAGLDEGGGVELRCPRNPSRLFARVWSEVRIVEGNLIEVACRDCRGRGMDRVLHRFNILGECVETVTVPWQR